MHQGNTRQVVELSRAELTLRSTVLTKFRRVNAAVTAVAPSLEHCRSSEQQAALRYADEAQLILETSAVERIVLS